MVELLNIDCMAYMAGLPDKHFDLAITDPPYGINAEQGTNRASRKMFKDKEYGWDSEIPTEEYFKELRRVSQNQIIWGGNYFLDYLGFTRGFIIWDKLNPDRCFSDCEFAWNSMDVVARIFKTKRVQELNKDDFGKIHPTQKPVALYKWLLHNYAICKKCNNEGSMYEDVVGDGGSKMLVDCEYCNVADRGVPKILDTHLGSGSSAIAAHKMGFDFVGCEIDPSYYNAAVKRYNEQIKQQSLFKHQ